MADVSNTASLVRPLPGAIVKRLKAAAALTIGQPVYMKTDGTIDKAKADAAGTVQAVGIVISVPAGKTECAASDIVDVCVYGEVTGFTSLTPGKLLYVSAANAGKLADARPGAGSYAWIVGRAWSETTMLIAPFTDDLAVLA